VIQRNMAGAIGNLNGSGIFEANGIGQRYGPVRIKYPVFGQSALAGIHRNPVSGSQAGHAGSGFIDNTGYFHALRKRRGWGILICPFLHQQIGKIQTAGPDRDANLTLLRFGNIYIAKPCGRTVCWNPVCQHYWPPCFFAHRFVLICLCQSLVICNGKGGVVDVSP